MGVELTLKKSQHTKLTGEENSPAAPVEVETRNLLIASLVLLPTSYPGQVKTYFTQINNFFCSPNYNNDF